MKELSNIKICVFDAYGTLFDVHLASKKLSKEIDNNYEEFSNLWRAKQLEYSFLREIMKEYKSFFSITEDALVYAMKTYKIDMKLKNKLMELYKKLDAYSEVRDILKELKDRGIKTVILSNGSYDMLSDAVKTSGIEEYMDNVLSVEEIELFKPNKAVYDMVYNKFGIDKENVMFFSSNGWAVAGASSYGFNTIWINRLRKEVDILNFKPTYVVSNLEEGIEQF
ncbi:MAG: haloacid dehalogenase type II [Sarcina sp.]